MQQRAITFSSGPARAIRSSMYATSLESRSHSSGTPSKCAWKGDAASPPSASPPSASASTSASASAASAAAASAASAASSSTGASASSSPHHSSASPSGRAAAAAQSHARFAISRNGYTMRQRCQMRRALVGLGCQLPTCTIPPEHRIQLPVPYALNAPTSFRAPCEHEGHAHSEYSGRRPKTAEYASSGWDT